MLRGDSPETRVGLCLPLQKPTYLKHIHEKFLPPYSLLSLFGAAIVPLWPAATFPAWLTFPGQAPHQLANASTWTPPLTYSAREFIIAYINKLIFYKYLWEISVTVLWWMTGSANYYQTQSQHQSLQKATGLGGLTCKMYFQGVL